MAIERLVLPEPLGLKLPSNYSSRALGNLLIMMYPDQTSPIKPGKYDITPEQSEISKAVHRLRVYEDGSAMLRLTPTILGARLREQELVRAVIGDQDIYSNVNRTYESSRTIDEMQPVLLQTLDGGSPRKSPIASVIMFSPEQGG